MPIGTRFPPGRVALTNAISAHPSPGSIAGDAWERYEERQAICIADGLLSEDDASWVAAESVAKAYALELKR